MDDEQVKTTAIEYVELEADTEVIFAEIDDRFTHWGSRAAVLSVETTDEDIPGWWVVAGETPTNLYPKGQFDNPDYVFSFHEGIMSRMADRQHQEANEPPKGEKFDAFISHASEDKDELVRQLAREMKRQGMWIWYDEDELEIGNSIRRSIDEGLSNSHCGVVVFSPSFFDKDWPNYELDGIVNKHISGKNARLLPVWHEVGADDIREYSPSLANIKAETTEGKEIEQIARNLRLAAARHLRE
jgi:hypothetical protein